MLGETIKNSLLSALFTAGFLYIAKKVKEEVYDDYRDDEE